ncbi:glycosyltransferase family 1 protein [Algoriphagus kandeliae]|uniref:Glycosyltransferase family 1 protein n=1 Tax=Algoriphagus kandeliae TaxID=2562278 RepID=A0A4Y9R192_9BACT|nr:glycosyltransferase [Algoriphagus kandeliae]TFV97263.1 glycosyltransferase family 1 protein [Algoriphagus kandeliae]
MKPKLLFISPSSPFPPRDGKRQRTLALLNAALIAYEVDFLILGASRQEISRLNENELKPNLHFFYLPTSKESRLEKIIGLSLLPSKSNRKLFKDFLKSKSYDKIFCRYASSARDLPSNCNFYLDVDDDYYEFMKTKISSQTSFWKKIRYGQIFILNRFFYKRILLKSKQLIWVKNQNRRGHVLPNLPFQILISGFQELPPPRSRNLLFVGKLSYEPNARGIQWFLEKVWPILKEEIPNIKLTIISSVKPKSELKLLFDESTDVKLEINVPNIHSIYKNHAICIVPIFSGGGSNVKLAEALIMGRKVISTNFGARGFENWISSGEIKLANNPKEWLTKISELINEPWDEASWEKIRSQFSLKDWDQQFLNILNES